MENKNNAKLIMELTLYMIIGISISLLFNVSLILVGVWLNVARPIYMYYKIEEDKKDAMMMVIKGTLKLAVFLTLVDFGMKLFGLNGFPLFK